LVALFRRHFEWEQKVAKCCFALCFVVSGKRRRGTPERWGTSWHLILRECAVEKPRVWRYPVVIAYPSASPHNTGALRDRSAASASFSAGTALARQKWAKKNGRERFSIAAALRRTGLAPAPHRARH
jgi:hypothetical protein